MYNFTNADNLHLFGNYQFELLMQPPEYKQFLIFYINPLFSKLSCNALEVAVKCF